MIKIAILDDYQDSALRFAQWDGLPGCTVDIFKTAFGSEDEVVQRLAPYDVLVAMRERTRFPRNVLARLPRLRLLVTTGSRNNAIDLKACADANITVSGTSILAYPTAELTWGLILSLVRRLPEEQRNLREGRWQQMIGGDLSGKTIGIVGLGKLGSRVARVAKAFDMNVLAWSANLTDDTAKSHGATRVPFEELLSSSDIVTIHLVLSERTTKLFGDREFSLMKKTAYLVNTSRAPIVDGVALAAALNQGAIAGAALDVHHAEPLPAHDPVLALPNTILTPHLGYVTEENYRIFYREAVEDIKAYLEGKPLRVMRPS